MQTNRNRTVGEKNSRSIVCPTSGHFAVIYEFVEECVTLDANVTIDESYAARSFGSKLTRGQTFSTIYMKTNERKVLV